MRHLPLLVLLLACDPTGKTDDTSVGTDSGADTDLTGDGFCAVQSLFNRDCVVCHDASSPGGDLDLETDPHTAIVGVTSALYAGRTLVVAGDPSSSFLITKLRDGQAAGEGDVMPVAGMLAEADIVLVETWIADGATSDCASPDTDTNTDYHPDGWDAPEAHGLAAKLQEDDCLACHGETLEGDGDAVSCDSCHSEEWRSDCTFCHGGVDNTTGAPPEGIRDETSADATSFPPHSVHVEETAIHVAFDCEQCHTKPLDIFSRGHLFVADTSAGVAEANFSGGLSGSASWSGTTCSNLYCHGNGQAANGTVTATENVSCGDCHAVASSSGREIGQMSGTHGDHDSEGVGCQECHATVVDAGSDILDIELHVNGDIDIALTSGMTRSGSTCTGTCHGEDHRSESWWD